MTAERVGRAEYQLTATLDELEAKLEEAKRLATAKGQETEQEFARTGERAVGRLGDLTRSGVTALAGAAGGMFAVATKGALDLENAQAKFKAATGATADEADRAGEAIQRMAGSNLQSIEQIGDTLTTVTTNFDLTGEAAEKLTQKFLDWSTATGQDAAEAAGEFDDLLTRLGLDAGHTDEVMDRLLATTQRWGGTVDGNTRSLKDMAPLLEATNQKWEDGAAFLGFMNDNGVDADAAIKGLGRSLKDLPPGTKFQDIVDQLAAIEDPAERAREATRLLGRTAGPQLAAALSEGRVSLDEYALSQDEVAGATERAAETIEGTWTNRIQLAIKGAGAALAGFGRDMGPLLTGASGLASLGTSIVAGLKLDEPLKNAFTSAFDSVKTMLPQMARRVGGAFFDLGGDAGMEYGEGFTEEGSTAVLEGTQGTIAGNLASNRIWKAYDDAGDRGGKRYGKAFARGVTGAITAASLVAAQGGSLFDIILSGAAGGAAFAAAPAALNAIAAGVTAIGGAAAAASGGVIALSGGLVALGLASVVSEEGAQRGAAAWQEQRKAWDDFALDVAAAQVQLAQMRGLGPELAADAYTASFAWGHMATDMLQSGYTVEQAMQQLRESGTWTEEDIAHITAQGQRVADAMVPPSEGRFLQWAQQELAPENLAGAWETAQVYMSAGAEGMMRAAANAAAEEASSFDGAMLATAARIQADRNVWQAAYNLGAGVPRELGQGTVAESRQVVTAMDHLRQLMEDALSGKQRMQEIGAKWLRDVARGLRHSVPEVQDAAVKTAAEGIQALVEGGRAGGRRAGRILGQLYASGMTEMEVRAALSGAGLSDSAIDEFFEAQRLERSRRGGRRQGEQHNRGLRDKKPDAEDAGKELNQKSLTAAERIAGWEKGGKTVGGKWVAGVEAKKTDAETAGEDLNDAAQTPANDQTGWYRGGSSLGGAWLSGLSQQLSIAADRVRNAMAGIKDMMGGKSPPPKGPLRTIDKDAAAVGRAWRIPFVAEVWAGVAEASAALASFAPALAGAGGLRLDPGMLRSQQTLRHEFSGTVRVELSPEHIRAMHQAGYSGDDVGRAAAAASRDIDGFVRDYARSTRLPIEPRF